MSKKFSEQISQSCQGQLLENEPLHQYNTWRVGGLAHYLYYPLGKQDVIELMRIIPVGMKILWLGLGSNVLIRDQGFAGIVIVTQGRLKQLQQVDEVTIHAEAGVSCAQVARFAARLGLSGAEFLAGVPGTIGGALAMNAGCHGHETWEFVRDVETLNRQGEVQIQLPSDFEIAYRTVKRKNDEWFLSANLAFKKGDKEDALREIRELLDKRAATQPTGDATCGSVFKNPEGDYSARLIENLGLKGFQIGGARVSEKHANFIVNDGHSTAKDIENLMLTIINKVEQNYGIRLIPEVQIVGEEI